MREVDIPAAIRYTCPMKKIIFFALLFIFPITAVSHPGKTDKYGGHKCLKDCEEWKLYYAEYHLHDKNMKPIRVARKPHKARKAAEVKSAAAETVLPVQAETPRTAQTVTVYRYVTTVREETAPIHPLLWVLLVLLLLLLILRVSRKEEGHKASRR